MPFGLHLPEMFIMVMTVTWIVGLAHCIINRRLSGINKFAWIILIFITYWIGAVVYFLYWFGFARRQHKQIAPVIQRVDPLPEQEYPSYTMGYQPAETTSVKGFVADVTESENARSTSPSAYEEIQITYSDDPR